MTHHYILTVDDHLAWYDHECKGETLLSRFLPALHLYLERRKRKSFARFMQSKMNATAVGTRSLEFTSEAVCERGEGFEFSTPWPEVESVVLPPTHLFIAHRSRNAHIVPLASFASDQDRESFVALAVSRGRGRPDNR
jgi:hypothetical protein